VEELAGGHIMASHQLALNSFVNPHLGPLGARQGQTSL